MLDQTLEVLQLLYVAHWTWLPAWARPTAPSFYLPSHPLEVPNQLKSPKLEAVQN